MLFQVADTKKISYCRWQRYHKGPFYKIDRLFLGKYTELLSPLTQRINTEYDSYTK